MYKDFDYYNPNEFITDWVKRKCVKGEGRIGDKCSFYEHKLKFIKINEYKYTNLVA